jgi:hypothetical protein
VGVVQCVVNGGVKDWKVESEKRWDLMCSVALSFICTVGDSVMICFPIKRCLSVSITHAVRTRDRGSEKIGSLNYFEVCGVYKKEPRNEG